MLDTDKETQKNINILMIVFSICLTICFISSDINVKEIFEFISISSLIITIILIVKSFIITFEEILKKE